MIQTDTYRTPPAFPLKPLLLLAALGLILAAALTLHRNGTHAVDRHGLDAIQIQRCLEENGPDEVWRMTSWRRPHQYIVGCYLPDGRIGLSLMRIIKSATGSYAFREITSFVVKSGTYQEFVEYVSARAQYAGESLANALGG